MLMAIFIFFPHFSYAGEKEVAMLEDAFKKAHRLFMSSLGKDSSIEISEKLATNIGLITASIALESDNDFMNNFRRSTITDMPLSCGRLLRGITNFGSTELVKELGVERKITIHFIEDSERIEKIFETNFKAYFGPNISLQVKHGIDRMVEKYGAIVKEASLLGTLKGVTGRRLSPACDCAYDVDSMPNEELDEGCKNLPGAGRIKKD
jgi:hypothetical protein